MLITQFEYQLITEVTLVNKNGRVDPAIRDLVFFIVRYDAGKITTEK